MEKNYNDEVYINNLVDNYIQTKDCKLKLNLIQEFDPYFKKYIILFCSKISIDLSNPDTRKFLRLFMNDEDRANEDSFVSAANKLIPRLRNLFKDCTSSDIYDEMVCGFLEHLDRYKPMIANHKHSKERISFTHFIQVNLRYHLAKIISKRSKDALCCMETIEFDDLQHGEVIEPKIENNWSNIDLEWIGGSTSGSIFSGISNLDRYFLFLKYESEDGKERSDRYISKITGFDRMYIRRRVIKIKEIIKQSSEALNQELI